MTTQNPQEWEEIAKPIIESMLCGAYEEFSTGPDFWLPGEMKADGVVADRMIEKLQPIIRTQIQATEKRGAERMKKIYEEKTTTKI